MNNTLLISIMVIFIIGIFLVTAYGFISKANSDEPSGSVLSQAILGIFTMGIIFIIMSIMIMFFCIGDSCRTCDSLTDLGEKSGLVVMISLASLGIVMAVLGGIIVSKGNSAESSANDLAVSIMIIGICLTCLIIGITIYMFRKGIKGYFKGHSKKETKKEELIEMKPLHGEDISQLADDLQSVRNRMLTVERKKTVLTEATQLLQAEIDSSSGDHSDQENRLKDGLKLIDETNKLLKKLTSEKDDLKSKLHNQCVYLSLKGDDTNETCKKLRTSEKPVQK